MAHRPEGIPGYRRTPCSPQGGSRRELLRGSAYVLHHSKAGEWRQYAPAPVCSTGGLDGLGDKGAMSLYRRQM